MKLTHAIIIFLLTVFALDPILADGSRARARINGSGIAGTANLSTEANDLVRVTVTLKGDPKVLTPGPHGFHFHEVGVCEPGGPMPFASAKGHFDPGPFGSSTPVEANHPYHLGDLPNIEIGANGEGSLDILTSRVALGQGPLNLLDSDGTAVIVHTLPDQILANGTAAEAGGGRLACGVLQTAMP